MLSAASEETKSTFPSVKEKIEPLKKSLDLHDIIHAWRKTEDPALYDEVITAWAKNFIALENLKSLSAQKLYNLFYFIAKKMQDQHPIAQKAKEILLKELTDHPNRAIAAYLPLLLNSYELKITKDKTALRKHQLQLVNRQLLKLQAPEPKKEEIELLEKFTQQSLTDFHNQLLTILSKQSPTLPENPSEQEILDYHIAYTNLAAIFNREQTIKLCREKDSKTLSKRSATDDLLAIKHLILTAKHYKLPTAICLYVKMALLTCAVPRDQQEAYFALPPNEIVDMHNTAIVELREAKSFAEKKEPAGSLLISVCKTLTRHPTLFISTFQQIQKELLSSMIQHEAERVYIDGIILAAVNTMLDAKNAKAVSDFYIKYLPAEMHPAIKTHLKEIEKITREKLTDFTLSSTGRLSKNPSALHGQTKTAETTVTNTVEHKGDRKAP